MSDRPADGTLGDVLDRLISRAEAEGAAAEDRPPTVEAAAPSTSAGTERGSFEGLLSNPALLSALPQLMKAFSGLTAASQAPPKPSDASNDGGGKPPRTLPVDRHTALLCALKPYLATERRQAAEQLINLCRVWGTLQGMGINFPALLSNPPADTVREGKGDERV